MITTLNIQQIPWFDEPDPAIAYRYHNCFYAEDGATFVSADFSSQELCLISHISQDPVWQEALTKGQDLHSVCASLIFGKKWQQVAESNCQFAKDKTKCKCKQHKFMRQAAKTIDFGLS